MKTKNIKTLYNIMNITIIVCGILCGIGFFMAYGGIGTFDFADDTHQIMSKAQEQQANTMIIIGLSIDIITAIIMAICYRIKNAAAAELKYRARRRRQMYSADIRKIG